MLRIPGPIQEIPWVEDDARMLCVCPSTDSPKAGGNLSLPASHQHRSGMGPDPSPFPPLNGSSRLCLEGLLWQNRGSFPLAFPAGKLGTYFGNFR